MLNILLKNWVKACHVSSMSTTETAALDRHTVPVSHRRSGMSTLEVESQSAQEPERAQCATPIHSFWRK